MPGYTCFIESGIIGIHLLCAFMCMCACVCVYVCFYVYVCIGVFVYVFDLW